MGYIRFNYVGENWTGGQYCPPGEIGDFNILPVNTIDNLARLHDWRYAMAEQARKAGQPDVADAIIRAADLDRTYAEKPHQQTAPIKWGCFSDARHYQIRFCQLAFHVMTE